MVKHVYREGNRCADWLACRVVSSSLGFHPFISMPNGLDHLLLGDVVGVVLSRFCISTLA